MSDGMDGKNFILMGPKQFLFNHVTITLDKKRWLKSKHISKNHSLPSTNISCWFSVLYISSSMHHRKRTLLKTYLHYSLVMYNPYGKITQIIPPPLILLTAIGAKEVASPHLNEP